MLSFRAVDQEGRHHWQPWFHRRFRAQQTVHPFLGCTCNKLWKKYAQRRTSHLLAIGFLCLWKRTSDGCYMKNPHYRHSNPFWPQAQIERYSWQNRPGFPNFSASWLPNIEKQHRRASSPVLKASEICGSTYLKVLLAAPVMSIRKIRTQLGNLWQSCLEFQDLGRPSLPEILMRSNFV